MKKLTNYRMKALENAAEKTARMLLKRRDIDVEVGSAPRYDWANKRLFLPAYSEEHPDQEVEHAWRGLVDHECSHVEHSDFQAIEAALEQWEETEGTDTVGKFMHLINVFEDIWIERAWGTLYPGSVRHFHVKNRFVCAQHGGSDVCDPEYRDPRTGQKIGMWGAFCQAVLRVGRGNVKAEDCAESVQNLMADCYDEIVQGWSAETTQDVIEASRALWTRLQELADEPEDDEEDDEEEEEEGDAEGDEEESGESESSSSDTGESEESEGSESGSEGEDEESEESEGSESGSGESEESEEGSGAASGAEESEGSDGGEAESPEPGKTPGGAGYDGKGAEERTPVDDALEGEWSEISSDAEVLANKYLDAMPAKYTVHPDARAEDTVITYDKAQRDASRPYLDAMRKVAGPAVHRLKSMLRSAVAASRMSRDIGGVEEGESLDPNAIPEIALGVNGPAIFQTTMQEVTESTFVGIVVDCSGSMHRSNWHCGGGNTKAAYAGMTALTLHEALRDTQIPHAVLGYTTGPGVYGPNPYVNGHPKYSRMTRSREDHVFVPAPGFHDDGAALPYITGRDHNLDGESVTWAARYCAAHGGQYDRVILIVIADGLPAGADDTQLEGQHLRESVEEICRAGIEVYGLGVGIRSMDTFRRYYPDVPAQPNRAPSGSIEIPTGKGLSSTTLRALTRLLTRGYGMSRRSA